MKKYLVLLLIAIPIVAVFSCHRPQAVDPKHSGAFYLDLPDTTYHYFDRRYVADTINKQATLGRVLFYDRALSINNSVSCGTCHKQVFAFSDNAALSAGFENRLTGRNTPAIQNMNIQTLNFGNGFGRNFGRLFWDGRETDLRNLVMRPVSNHVEMGIIDYSSLIEKLKGTPYYKKLFLEAFNSEEITIDRLSTAMAIFMTAIRSDNTRLDRYFKNVGSDLTALELDGMALFESKYNCNSCHNANLGGYSGNDFMSIGLDAPYSDPGLGGISGRKEDMGLFKIPNLRNVGLTAPYMHDGRFKTLEEVIDHYSHGIKADVNLDEQLKDPASGKPIRMNITAHDKQALIAFLHTLTDMDMITDPALSDPFKIQ